MTNYKPKLLIIAPQNPHPPVDGGKIGIYYPLLNYPKYFDVYFACLVDLKTPKEEIEKSKRHYEENGIKFFYSIKDKRDKIWKVLLNLFSKDSFKWEKFYSKSLLFLCKNVIENNQIEFVWINHAQMSIYAEKLKSIFQNLKIFLREHNLEYEIVMQFASYQSNPIVKYFSYWQYRKTKRMEIYRWKFFDKVFFISDIDFREAIKEAPSLSDKFEVLYDGYNLKLSENKTERLKPSFIYPVVLQYAINRECLRSFYYEIWLKIKDKFEDLILEISGNPKGTVASVLGVSEDELIKNRVLDVGFLDDIESEILKRKYVLSPTKAGSGIRIKLLLGMAMGKPVFCSKLDAQTSSYFKDMENIVAYDSAEEFAEKLQKLEIDTQLYIKICQNAYETIKNYFTWELYAEKVYCVIVSLKN